MLNNKEKKTDLEAENAPEKNENIDFKKAYKEKLSKKDDEIAKLSSDVENWKNNYYKAYADMANLRKTIEKDQKESYKYRIEGFAQNLLGVLDAFDMAFKGEASNEELKNYLTGFQYVHNQLLSILNDEGIKEIVPKIGDKFDVSKMHAIETVEDDGEENLIKEVSLKGYSLHDHLIRPAMVVVTKHHSTEANNDKKDVTDVDVK